MGEYAKASHPLIRYRCLKETILLGSLHSLCSQMYPNSFFKLSGGRSEIVAANYSVCRQARI
jgi:hypothetical protein